MAVTASLLNAFFGTCDCRGFFDCTLPVDSNGGLFLWLALALYTGKALLTMIEHYFMPCLGVFENRSGLSHHMASATLLAAGSTASLLFINFAATLLITSELGVGVIIGSSGFHFLLIIGLVGLTGCEQTEVLKITPFPLLRDFGFYLVAWAELVGFLSDGKVYWYESFFMLFTYLLYCVFMYFNTRIMFKLGVLSQEAVEEALEAASRPAEKDDLVSPAGGEAEASSITPAADSALRHAGGVGDLPPVGTTDAVPPPPLPAPASAPPEATKRDGGAAASPVLVGAGSGAVSLEGEADRKIAVRRAKQSSYLQRHDPLSLCWAASLPLPEMKPWRVLAISLLFISILAYFLVDAAHRSALVLNVSHAALGLLLVAPGASSLALANALEDVHDGAADLYIANGLSESLFGIQVSLGLPWFIYGISGVPVEFRSGSVPFLLGNLIAILVMLILLVVILLIRRWRVTRTESIALLAGYGLFVFGNFIGFCAGAGL